MSKLTQNIKMKNFWGKIKFRFRNVFKTSPLKVSILFSILEIALYIFITYFSAEHPYEYFFLINPMFWKSFIVHTSNMIMAIATTWYVIFTYFILRITDESRKQSSEPFLSFSWSSSNEIKDEKFSDINLAKNLLTEASKTLISFDSSQESVDYINLEIMNERRTECGSIECIIEIAFNQPDDFNFKLYPKTISYKKESLRLKFGEKIVITVLSTDILPDSFELLLKLVTFHYTAIDSNELIFQTRGEKSFKKKGSYILQMRPQINIIKKEN